MQLPRRIAKYELLEFLGGGSSEVYRARDTVIGRTVAIKCLTWSGQEDIDTKRRFLAEAKLLGTLHHDNILSIYDYGEDQGRPYIVMEFLRGENLRSAIASNHVGDLNNKLRIALDVARALEYTHDNGVIHRDVKPENVNLGPDGKVKLIDFGIAKNPDLSVTKTGYIMGTPYYMAPEQVMGIEITRLVDVYGFGMLLFEMVTGAKAYSGDSLEVIFYKTLHQPLDFDLLEKAGAPKRLRELVESCTKKGPQERIQGFGLVIAELNRLLRPELGIGEQTTDARLTIARSAGVLGVLCSLALGLAWLRLWLNPRGQFLAGWPVSLGFVAVAVGVVLALWLLRRRVRLKPSESALGYPGVRPSSQSESRAVRKASSEFLLVSTLIRAPQGHVQSEDLIMNTRVGEPIQASRDPEDVSQRPDDPSSWLDSVEQFLKIPVAPPPPPATHFPLPPQPQSDPPEFTRQFLTAPDRPPQLSPVQSSSALPIEPPAPQGRIGEDTQMFRVDKESPSPDATIVPNVALTITACVSVAYVGRQFPINFFPFRIGRPSSALALPFDPAISREHAEIQFTNGGFAIEDLGSANGTFVNGHLLQAHRPEPLLFGARILLGSNTELTFVTNELNELPDLTGGMIGERYRLISEIASSTKSVAYRATDTKLPGQLVLVKILSPQLAKQPGYREQFEREAKIASRLRHAHVARILDYGETAFGPSGKTRTMYLSTEFLDGGSLAQRLDSNQRFELDRVVAWLEKLASSLDYVHEEGVIHGGIKPSSIVFDSRDNPYLTDFAIAITAGDAAHGTIIGAPAFLAPEQWEGRDPTPATDQYSLAALLYRVMTGSHPYEGQEHPAIRQRNLLHEPAAAHETARQNGCPTIPVAVSAVLHRAMSLEPSARFETVTELATNFRSALLVPIVTHAKKTRIFISYSRASGSPWALLFKNELEREYGYKVFVDTEQQERAGLFPIRLENYIAKCDIFVCLLGKGTLQSPWVNWEIQKAHERQKPMVPVFQEAFRLPGDLQQLPLHVRQLLDHEGVKLFDRQNAYVLTAIKSLSEIIQQLLTGM